MSHQQEQKTIAKNTVFLYFRMFLVMFVSLYTSRIVLDRLGIENYGIYNIVGSIVVSFVFVQNSLSSSTQRFMSYAMGSGEKDCHRVFSISMNIHIIILMILLLILETVGVWCLYNVLNIPSDRIQPAFIVFQLSVCIFSINLLRVPFTALIISRERMAIYAYYSILDVFLLLGIAYIINIDVGIDKLILYSMMNLFVTICSTAYIVGYCRLKLSCDSRYEIYRDKSTHKEMFSFVSWNLVGGLTGIASAEGPNYFMNYYLGVTVNAAMGIAKQVSTAIYTFSSNFQQAFNPQIVKSYANKDWNYMFNLIFRTSKLSFYLIFVIAAPFIICCDEVLDIWLVETPKYVNSFCICMLTTQMVAALSSPFWMAAHAIGHIKKYQLCLCGFNLAVIPIAFFVLSQGFEPYWVLIGQIILNISILIYRCAYLYYKISFPVCDYAKQVVFRVFLFIPVISLPLLKFVSNLTDGLTSIIFTSTASLFFTTILFVYLGLTKDERNFVIKLLIKRLKK